MTIGETIWHDRAERLLEQALDEVQDGIDALLTLSAAEATLRVAYGELPEDELEGYPFPGEEVCICPPDLLERGGYRGGCPVHSLVM